MTIKYFSLLIIGILLLSRCGNSTKNNTMTINKADAKDSCCSKDSTAKKMEIVIQSEITCPKCGHRKMETMPTDVCVIKYNCEKCQVEMRPKEGDCCVFCTYGTHKCPSMQQCRSITPTSLLKLYFSSAFRKLIDGLIRINFLAPRVCLYEVAG